jgi:hypothetical protein
MADFCQFLAGCTDAQLLGCYDKERAADRPVYLELVKIACRNRGVYYGED